VNFDAHFVVRYYTNKVLVIGVCHF